MIKTNSYQKTIPRNILLNPGPGTTSQAIKEALLVADICPREEVFGQLMKDICQGLLQISGGEDTHEVSLFAASGTGAMESTLISALAEDDEVLIITNGAYGLRMEQICECYGIPYDTAFSFGDYPEPTQIKKVLSSGRYTFLAMPHHETSTGMMNPLEEIALVCKELGVKLIVDAMSSFGAYPIDLKHISIDYLFSSSNKCLQGMPGLSFVLFKKDRLEDLRSNQRAFYLDLYSQWQNLHQKKQMRFTPPVQICYALKAAIEETQLEGLENRWRRYQDNWQILFDGFRSLGFQNYLPDQYQSKILLALDLNSKPDLNFNALHDYLYKRQITIYPGVIPECNTFRVAVIGDLYPTDMQWVLKNIVEYFTK